MDLYKVIEQEIKTIESEPQKRTMLKKLHCIQAKQSLELVELLIEIMVDGNKNTILFYDSYYPIETLREAREIAKKELQDLQ